jgi:hypothetical protein
VTDGTRILGAAYGALLGWAQEKLVHRAGHVTASDFSGNFGWDKVEGLAVFPRARAIICYDISNHRSVHMDASETPWVLS